MYQRFYMKEILSNETTNILIFYIQASHICLVKVEGIQVFDQ